MYLITLHKSLGGGRNESWERRQSRDQFMKAIVIILSTMFVD